MSEYGIPVVFDVTAPDRLTAAHALATRIGNAGLLTYIQQPVTGLAASIAEPPTPVTEHLQVESWWFPEADLKHIDQNDEDAFVLVHQTLPTDEDGHIDTSAEYGESYLVRILWNTDHDGRPIPDDEDPAQTLHGPFVSEEEAAQWIHAYPDDTDIHDMETVVMNNVRPREEHDH